jgi:hypothetical protein
MILRLFLLAVFACMCPTSARADDIPSRKLAKPGELSYFVLPDTVTVHTTVGKVHLYPVLAKGRYVSVYEDADGTFYQGPKDCLPNPNPKAVFPALDGGLWIPRDSSRHETRFWVLTRHDKKTAEMGVLIAAIDRATTGKVRKDSRSHIEDAGFLASLTIRPYAPPAEGEIPSASEPASPVPEDAASKTDSRE